MAITTYSELQTAIANWLDRSDLTDRIPEFISLAEARFIRKLNHWRMEGRSTANTVAGTRTLALPSDYIAARNFKINTSTVDVLEYMPPSVLYEGSSSQGTPKYYTIQGSQLVLEPIPDSVYQVELNYTAFSKLSDSNTTNWLLTYFPDAYLYGSLVQGSAYMINDERVPMWKAALDEVIKEIQKEDRAARWNGTPLTIRVEV